MNIICLGIAVVDILTKPVDRTIFDRDNTLIESMAIYPGGDAANQAITLKKLGADAALCCRIGSDTMGGMLCSALESYGVNTSLVRRTASVTSTAIVLISPGGDRNIICVKGNNYDFCFEDIDLESIKKCKFLSVGSLFGLHTLEERGLSTVLKLAQEHGAVTFADMTSDKKGLKLKGIAPFLPYIDYFLPSEYESEHLTGLTDCREAARAFLDAGTKNVIVKLGKRGVYARCRDFTGYVDPYLIEAVDTTGAGDSFCAGFVYGRDRGWDTYKSLEFACACGALNSLSMGASTAPMQLHMVEEFMRAAPRAHLYT